MCSQGMVVHCPSCLGAAATLLAAELTCVDGVSTEWAFENRKAVHRDDRVMSQCFNCRLSSPV